MGWVTYFDHWNNFLLKLRLCRKKIKRIYCGLDVQSKIHLVKWGFGGFGIIDLRLKNRAPLNKWIWWYANESHSLWLSVISNKNALTQIPCYHNLPLASDLACSLIYESLFFILISSIHWFILILDTLSVVVLALDFGWMIGSKALLLLIIFLVSFRLLVIRQVALRSLDTVLIIFDFGIFIYVEDYLIERLNNGTVFGFWLTHLPLIPQTLRKLFGMVLLMA